MTQKDEDDLLHEICRNASMGVEAIHEVLKDIYDEEFAYELNVQADKAQQFGRKAGMRLRESGGRTGRAETNLHGDAENSDPHENNGAERDRGYGRPDV